tara:strand:+ start:257 stop:517 length:261 start_codon:yes stop_codon:yes gene_type:complete
VITTALFIGGAATGAVALLYSKMPKFLKKFAVRHYLVSDILLTVGLYLALGTGTATVISAMIIAWVATSVLLAFKHYQLVAPAQAA